MPARGCCFGFIFSMFQYTLEKLLASVCLSDSMQVWKEEVKKETSVTPETYLNVLSLDTLPHLLSCALPLWSLCNSFVFLFFMRFKSPMIATFLMEHHNYISTIVSVLNCHKNLEFDIM